MSRQWAAAEKQPVPLMTPKEVMAYLRCSRSFVQDHKADLGGRMVGRLLRFDPGAVQAFGQQTPAPAQSAQQTAPTPTRLHPRIDTSTLPPLNPVTGRSWDWERT